MQCNGPNAEQNDVDMFYGTPACKVFACIFSSVLSAGKGLISKPLYEAIYKKCEWPSVGPECEVLLEQASLQVGPHNVGFVPLL